jgi:two-component system, chemotaxis family, CheB/CheR fusion protein
MARVLVVDDNLSQVHSLMMLLRVEGHTAEGRGDARQIVEGVREFKPDVVVMDLGLPEISGWEAAKQIRENLGEESPVLIALTGEYTQPSDKALAERAGFDAYLVKPCDPSLLLQLIGPSPNSR